MRKGIQISILAVIFLFSSLPFHSKVYPVAHIWFRDAAESQSGEGYTKEIADSTCKQAAASILDPETHRFHAAEHALDYRILPSIRIEYTDGTSISFGISANGSFFRTAQGEPQGTWFINPAEYELLQNCQAHSTKLATPYQP